MADDRWSMADGRWPMGDGRWAMTDGRWAMADDWTLGDGRWPMDSELLSDGGGGQVQVVSRDPRSFCDPPANWPLQGDRMSGMKNYKELDAWKVAMTLVETTYRLTKSLPDGERYGLVTQMQRSAISIPSNLAEGQARGTTRFGLYYIRVALGSLAELDTQIELARRLGFVTDKATSDLEAQLDRVRRMLYGMRREHERRVATASATITSVILLLFASAQLL